MPFLVSLFFRSTQDISTPSRYIWLSPFGFDVNGTYEVTFSDFLPGRPYCFALLPTEEYDRNPVDDSPCMSHHPHSFSFGLTLATTATTSGSITAKDIYYPFLSFSNSEPIDFNSIFVTSTLRNRYSYQDYQWNGIRELKLFLVSALLLFVVYWFVDWFRFFQIQIRVHHLLTSVFSLMTVYAILRAIELSVLIGRDSVTGLSITVFIAQIIAEGSLYTAFLLIAKGWCIIRDSLAIGEVIFSAIYSAAFLVFRLSLQFITNQIVVVVFLLLALLSLLLFVHELVRSIGQASRQILAHMVAISNSGINPRTTPVYQQFILYTNFQRILVVAALSMLLYYCIGLFFVLPYVIDEGLRDATVLFVLGALAYVFRLRGAGNGAYVTVESQDFETETGEVIVLSDLDGVNVNSSRLNQGRPWNEGMRLPAQPNLLTAPPEGTDALHRQIGTRE
jgi:hypothetical protein